MSNKSVSDEEVSTKVRVLGRKFVEIKPEIEESMKEGKRLYELPSEIDSQISELIYLRGLAFLFYLNTKIASLFGENAELTDPVSDRSNLAIKWN